MNWMSLSLSLVPIAALVVASDLLAAANVMGAGIGKMICPQSVAIGTAAALVADRAGDAFKRMLPWFFAVLLLACLVCAAFV